METYNPLYSFWFWLAFWGFAFAAIFGYAILNLVVPTQPPDEVADDPTFWQRVQDFRILNRPWYYVLPIWLVMLLAALNANAAFVADTEPIGGLKALFIFAVGLSYIGGYLFMRYGTGRSLTAEQTRRGNMVLIVGVLGSFIIMFALGFRLSLKRTNELKAEQNKILGKVVADTTVPVAIRHRLDSLYAKQTSTDSLIAKSLQKQNELDKKLNKVVDNTTPTPTKRKR